MLLRHPIKQYGDYRQYPYPSTAEELDELAAELARTRDLLAVEKMKNRVFANLVRRLAGKEPVSRLVA